MATHKTHRTMMDNKALIAALQNEVFTVVESSGIHDGQITLVFDVKPAFAEVVNGLAKTITEAIEKNLEQVDITDEVRGLFDAQS